MCSRLANKVLPSPGCRCRVYQVLAKQFSVRVGGVALSRFPTEHRAYASTQPVTSRLLLQAASSRVRAAVCWQPSASNRVQAAKCKQPSASSRVQATECKQPSTSSRIQTAECEQPSTSSRVQAAVCPQPSAHRRVRTAETSERALNLCLTAEPSLHSESISRVYLA